ncbi:ROK family protein [Patescibacteria group bacterium]|nr:MAG: ROK family protein [Patescibacteria group bacterium]
MNLRGWSKKPLAKELKKIFGAPVLLENDAGLAGLGEAVYGAGKGKKIVAYLTISTGVGGARIVDEKIDKNAFGFEPGHQIVFLNKKFTTLENIASGTAIEKKYGKKPFEIFDAKIWDNVAKDLAYGLHNVAVLWSPDIIILGGSMMKKIGIPVERVKFHLSKILKIFPKSPLIKKSKLGDLAGLYGALARLKS